MQLIYIVFVVFALYAECSIKVDTKSIVKKLGLWIIAVGCLVALSSEASNIKQYFNDYNAQKVERGK